VFLPVHRPARGLTFVRASLGAKIIPPPVSLCEILGERYICGSKRVERNISTQGRSAHSLVDNIGSGVLFFSPIEKYASDKKGQLNRKNPNKNIISRKPPLTIYLIFSAPKAHLNK